MAAYIDGDPSAFDRLFALLAPRLHAFFMRSFRSDAVADDLIQTTFLKLHRARGDYRRGERVRPWIFAIAARVRLDEYRRRRRLSEDFDEEAQARGEGAAGGAPAAELPEAEAEASEISAHVQAALAALPESQRTIVHLHRFEGLTFREIAAALGTTEGAVKLRAFRAYGRLRKQLGPIVERQATAAGGKGAATK